MNRTLTRTTAMFGLLALGLTLAACSDDTSGGDESSGPTKVTFWGWAPGYGDAVAAFNKSHPDIQVTYEEISPGAKGGYDKVLTAVKAGNAPCLAQVGYETLPSFVAQGALADVSSEAASSEGEFAPAAWSAVTVGGVVHGAPVDLGPVAMFYRADIFKKLGLAVPKTWDEFEAAGVAIHKDNPDHYLTSAYLDYDYAGFAQQAGAPWFSIDGDTWGVSIDSPENQQVAQYWQGVAGAGLISPAPMWDQSWYKALGDGSIATHVGAAWTVGVLKGNAADGAGKWAVAPMPQWTADAQATANVGGSATAVVSGCADPAAAWEFAHWMSTDRDAYSGLVESAGLYPAATALLDLPALSKGDPYFGGQEIWNEFATSSAQVVPGWTWGPNMPVTVGALDDALSKAWAGNGSVGDALAAAQQKTVSALEGQGLTVTQ